MDKVKELLQEIMWKVYKISSTTKADVFLDYHGHVNFFVLSYYKNGFDKNKDCTYIAFNSEVTVENLEKALQELEKLEKELKENV